MKSKKLTQNEIGCLRTIVRTVALTVVTGLLLTSCKLNDNRVTGTYPLDPKIAKISDKAVVFRQSLDVQPEIEDVVGGVFSCTFDRQLDGEVKSGSSCSGLRGLEFSSSTGRVRWVPDYDQEGAYEVKITVAAGEWAGEQVFTLRVQSNGPHSLWGLGGEVAEVVVSGSYLYAANCNGLEIFDGSQLPQFIRFSKLSLDGCINEVTIYGDYAYLTDYLTIHIIDIHDPAAPKEVGQLSVSGGAYDMQAAAGYLYVNGKEDFYIYDLSDPKAPNLVGSRTYSGAFFGELIVDGSYAYISGKYSATHGVSIIDISDPTSPGAITQYAAASSAYDMHKINDSLYFSAQGVEYVDVSNPASPTQSDYFSHTWLRNPFVSGSRLFFAMNEAIYEYDNTDRSNPTFKAHYPTEGGGQVEALIGDFIIVTDGDNGLKAIDVSTGAPTSVRSFEKGYEIYSDFTYNGSHVYMWTLTDMKVFDVSDPDNIVEIGSLSLSDIKHVEVDSGYVYVARGTNGVSIVDVSTPSSPSLITTHATPTSAVFTHVSGGYAYISDSDSIQIVDISNPSSPSTVGVLPHADSGAGYIDVEGTLLAFQDFDEMFLVDVSDPANPALLGQSYFPGKWLNGVKINGSEAYVWSNDGIYFFDITDPGQPQLYNYYSEYNGINDVLIVGQELYATGRGINVFEISSPLSTDRLKRTPAAGIGTNHMEIVGSRLFVLNQYEGLSTMDLPLKSSESFWSGQRSTFGGLTDLDIAGDYGFAVSNRLVSFDLSDPVRPLTLDSLHFGANIRDVFATDDAVYLASERNGLAKVDTSNPKDLKVASRYVDGESYRCVAKVGEYVVGHTLTELRVFSEDSDSKLKKIGGVVVGDLCLQMRVRGDYIFIAADDEGLVIVDLSTPSNPTIVGQFDVGDDASTLALNGNYAFVRFEYYGLYSLDISDPTNPIQVGSITSGIGEALDMIVLDDMIIANEDYWGLQNFDIADPTNMGEGAFYFQGLYHASGFNYKNGFLYLVDRNHGLEILNFIDPSSPSRRIE